MIGEQRCFCCTWQWELGWTLCCCRVLSGKGWCKALCGFGLFFALSSTALLAFLSPFHLLSQQESPVNNPCCFTWTSRYKYTVICFLDVPSPNTLPSMYRWLHCGAYAGHVLALWWCCPLCPSRWERSPLQAGFPLDSPVTPLFFARKGLLCCVCATSKEDRK